MNSRKKQAYSYFDEKIQKYLSLGYDTGITYNFLP